MKLKVYYTSSKHLSEAMADVIANAVGVHAECLYPAFMPDAVDLMFLGCDGSRMNPVMQDFIGALKSDRVRYAALFNANPKVSSRALEQMRAALAARGIIVLENTLLCLSRSFQRDLPEFERTAALDFANSSVREVAKHPQQ